MAWLTRVDGKWHSTDDLTLDELAAIEKVAETGWAFLNPMRNTASARALLAAWMLRDGVTDEVAAKTIGDLTGKTLKYTFRYVEDDDLPDDWEDGLPVVDPKAPEVTSTG